MAINKKTAPVRLGIALQGGGSYGAYTKGVIKALFNSKSFNAPGFEIASLTGTSAGAVNGALIAYGLNAGGDKDGKAKALAILDAFWREIGDNGRLPSLLSAMDPLSQDWPNLSQSFLGAAGFLPRGFVSRQLKTMLERYIPDWSKVQSGPVRLFVNAVHEDSKTGARSHKVFKGADLTADAVTASGALAEFGAHEYNGARYFDGAYWRNPCLSDIKKENITDLLVVTLQKKPAASIVPEHQDSARARHAKPGHELMTEEIHNHIAHIHQTHPQINLHVIGLEVDPRWNRSSRMNNDPRWLAKLEETGYRDGLAWLAQHGDKLGVKSSYGIATPSPPPPATPAP